jgi:hypothetical protein
VLQALNVNVDDPMVCPACHKRLKTMQGLTAHLRTAKSCQWYKKGKLRSLMLPGEYDREDEVQMRDVEEELPAELEELMDAAEPAQVMEDFHDRLFDLVPMQGEQEHGHSPSPWNNINGADDDVDLRVEVPHPTAGRVIRIDESVHQRWRREFPGVDEEGDVPMEDVVEGSSSGVNRFAPFASELDWRVACWVVQDGIGHKSFDRLMAIPGVRYTLCYYTLIYLTGVCLDVQGC